MIKKDKTVITTPPEKKTVESVPHFGGSLSTNQLRDGRLNLSDKDYVLRYGKPEDFADARKKILERRSKIPAYSLWRCPGCGWKTHFDGEAPERNKENPIPCIRCNIRRYSESKGWLVEMTKKEAEQFVKDGEIARKKDIERSGRAGLFNKNQERQRQGLSPFTMEQFKEAERSRGGKK